MEYKIKNEEIIGYSILIPGFSDSNVLFFKTGIKEMLSGHDFIVTSNGINYEISDEDDLLSRESRFQEFSKRIPESLEVYIRDTKNSKDFVSILKLSGIAHISS